MDRIDAVHHCQRSQNRTKNQNNRPVVHKHSCYGQKYDRKYQEKEFGSTESHKPGRNSRWNIIVCNQISEDLSRYNEHHDIRRRNGRSL